MHNSTERSVRSINGEHTSIWVFFKIIRKDIFARVLYLYTAAIRSVIAVKIFRIFMHIIPYVYTTGIVLSAFGEISFSIFFPVQ